jgi:hypothetical protein
VGIDVRWRGVVSCLALLALVPLLHATECIHCAVAGGHCSLFKTQHGASGRISNFKTGWTSQPLNLDRYVSSDMLQFGEDYVSEIARDSDAGIHPKHVAGKLIVLVSCPCELCSPHLASPLDCSF